MRLLLLIPALNVERSLAAVIRDARRAAPDASIVVVDDGSTDGTARVASAGGARVVSHGKNLGKGAALRTGFRTAIEEGFDTVVTLDADGQHPPDRIPAFLSRFEETGADIIVGSRRGDHGPMPIHRRFSNRLTSYLASRAAGKPLPDSQSGYRLIRTEVLRAVPLRTTHYETETELLVGAARRGFRIDAVPIPARYADETSHISILRDTWRFARLLAAMRKESYWKS